jgi:Mn2+/Fe2+ NRAMP family transporter
LALLIHGPVGAYVVGFAVGCVLLEVFVSYERYVAILKWSCLTLFAYVATALAVDVPWGTVAYNTFIPNFSFKEDYVVAIVAVLGTTVTPYCFFWQSSQEAQDERIDPLAHTLNAHGITDIQTSSQAAEALRPIDGIFTFVLFSAAIIGIGLLTVPVLAASCAYALGETLGWTTGLDRQPLDAKAFYVTIAVSTLIGIGINFVGMDPIEMLFWAAVINGVVSVPLKIVMMVMAMAPKVMGDFVLLRTLWVMGWLCTATMTVAVGIMFWA